MPQVQRYGGRKVATDPLQGGRRTASETALSTGAGLAQAEAQRGEALAGFGETAFRASIHVSRVQQEARDNANRIALAEADTELSQGDHKRLYDPETGALTIKGKDAMPLPEQVQDDLNQRANTIEQRLTSEQRARFQMIRAQHSENLDGTIRRHVFQQMQEYEAGVVQATVETAHESALANAPDARRVAMDMKKGVDTIAGAAKSQGWSPEMVQKKVDDFQSATMAGVINNLLAGGQTMTAQQYFRDNKDLLKGEALTRVENALKEGTLRGAAQKKTDEILAQGGTLTEQRERARGIDDPDLRDQVQQRLEHEAVIVERADREQEERTLTDAYTILDKTQDVRNIPPATWANLPGSARSALRNYAEHLAGGKPPDTDLPTYYALMQQAADDPETFAKQNLLNYRHKLGEGEFKQFAQMQAGLRSGDRKAADKDLAGYRTKNDILEDTLTQYGINPKAKPDSAEGKAIAQLRRMLDVRVEAVQSDGKKITNTEIQSALDGLLSQSEQAPGSWWGLWPFSSATVFSSQKRLIDLTITDVPPSRRRELEEKLRSRRYPVTDATVLDLYAEEQLRTKTKR